MSICQGWSSIQLRGRCVFTGPTGCSIVVSYKNSHLSSIQASLKRTHTHTVDMKCRDDQQELSWSKNNFDLDDQSWFEKFEKCQGMWLVSPASFADVRDLISFPVPSAQAISHAEPTFSSLDAVAITSRISHPRCRILFYTSAAS